MSIGTLRFKQLLTGPFDGDGFYVKYGSFPGLQIETQSPQHIIDNIVNNPNHNWSQNTTVSVPTYKSDVNKIKVELPLDYISANPNFKNIVLYVLVAGNLLPYAISEPIPENMKSKNVDILSIYFTMPAGQNIKGIGSNRIALPDGINEFPLVASEGSWATKIFYEELRDSIPLGLPTGKNGVFYDDNARVTDLRVPSSGNSGGGINIAGGGSEIEMSSSYRHSSRNTPGGSEEKAFTEKGAQALYGETALIEGKHWEGPEAIETTLWSGTSPIWNKKPLTHLQALNIGEGDLPAPESLADMFKRMTFSFFKFEQGIFHIIKPITKGDVIREDSSGLNSEDYYKRFNFKKRDFFPDYPGNISTFVDDLDTENIHLPGDYDYELTGANVVDASLTLIDEYGYFQTLGGFTPLQYYPFGGNKESDRLLGSLDVSWTTEKIVISFSSPDYHTIPEIPFFVLPTYDGGLYSKFDDKSIVGYLTLHVAKRFFFLSNTNSIYRWNPPKIETVKFQTSFIEKEISETPGERSFNTIKTALPYVVELVKLDNPHTVDLNNKATHYYNGTYKHVFYLNDNTPRDVLAENHLGNYFRKNMTHKDKGLGGKHSYLSSNKTSTWSSYESLKDYYGVKIYALESVLNSDYDINFETQQLLDENLNTANYKGDRQVIKKIRYSFKKTGGENIIPGEEVNGYRLLTSSSYPTGVFPIALPTTLDDNDFIYSKESNIRDMKKDQYFYKAEDYQTKPFVDIISNNGNYEFRLKIHHFFDTLARVDVHRVTSVPGHHPKDYPEGRLIDQDLREGDSGDDWHLEYDINFGDVSTFKYLKEIRLSPRGPQLPSTKKKVREVQFEGEFRLTYGSTTRINRENQIKINNEVVGNIPDNVTNNGTFSVTTLVKNYRASHPGNLKLAIGVSGETIFGNTIEGEGFSGDIILS